jgi:phage terminase small subunit
MENKLTAKQRAFCETYLIDLNATQAAVRAGYSKRTAQQMGSENLSKPVIQAAIKKAMDERSKRTDITLDRVLQEIATMSFIDIRQIFTEGGQLKAIETLGDDIALGIQSIEVVVRPTGDYDDEGNAEVEHVHKIRLADKYKGLELLMRHLGGFNQNQQGSQGVFSIILDYGGGLPPRQVGNYVAVDGEPA